MELKLPELGEGVHEGELVKWHVKPGDVVKDDQVVCEIMTDKATVELPVPFSGKVVSLEAKEGQTVHVGQVMVRFADVKGAGKGATTGASGGASAHSAPAAPAGTTSAPMAMAAASAAPSSSVTVGGTVTAAPSTRRFAREQGVDLLSVVGTGPAGRVMREDVIQATRGGGSLGHGSVGSAPARSVGATAAPMAEWGSVSSAAAGALTAAGVLKPGFNLPWKGEERVPFKGLRKKIAEKMRASKDHAAHFTYVEEADATALVALRNQAKDLGAKMGLKVTYLPILMKAMVAALRKYPILNATLDESTGELVYKYEYNIGLSIQTEDGLTAPVVKNVAAKSVFQLAKEIQDLVDRARAKKLTMDDLTGGTITLTNAGSIGGLFATPIINYPEVAIVGFNKIFRKPVVRSVKAADGSMKEEIVVRDWTYFSISLDHRIVDGAVAAEFMKTLIEIIENPQLLVLN